MITLTTNNKISYFGLDFDRKSTLQLIVFIFAANIPALITGRMSYVDLAWPWGLFTIGKYAFCVI